ncbi:trehalose 6-phosphate phosphorylase [Carbonactinospora thermoautotrophica]|uniref:glycoside hydrolase family 65 protein n=1 Tax=Carbonactinospora thermoautotrophica TaxID=1469144 RepID=UPI00226F8A9C|nr:glycosyl hydrolase family 65 protein [Carbonactinospora thermoautotrophica]MCX9193402.1 trehalose 6-phosphate phosphorylase [Carbonactinospora thermoautotrophica]
MGTWTLEYEGYDPATERLRESLCALGNGYFMTRGAAPECTAGEHHYPGTYVAGCYDRLVSGVAGRVVENEDLVNLPNWLPLRFRAAGTPWFTPDRPGLLEYRQVLDLRRGVLTRTLRYRDPRGHRTRVTQRRFVHAVDPHLAGLETTILAEDWSGRLEVESALDGTVTNAGVARYRDLNGEHLRPAGTGSSGADVVWLQARTATSCILIAEAARTRLTGDVVPEHSREEVLRPRRVAHRLVIPVRQGQAVTIEKIAALHTSRDFAISSPVEAAVQRVQDAAGFQELLDSHVLAWDHLWRRADLRIGGEAGDVLRLHIFHVLQTLSPHTADLDVGVPARGLHGEAYRGHVFWDELFVLPYLNLRFPEISRGVLTYRWRRLPAARRAARQAGYAGAMYPWQSGSDGREESQELHLNPLSGRWLPDHSRLQRHVGSAIAYNVWQYYQATGDTAFLYTRGGEMLLEVARFWASAARYDRALDRYRICGVVGPDEYHDAYPDADRPGLDDNAYTNVTAAWTLCRALDLAQSLPAPRRAELFERLGVRREELERWEEVSRRLRVPFHRGVISQFEGYGELAELDWDRYRASYGDIRRLDRILEAEGDTVNRYQASKQADVLMLGYLFSLDELAALFARLGYRLDEDTWRRTVDYYMRRTSHGSTLSSVVHAWVLARTRGAGAWRYFREALASDIADIQGGTTPEGVHLGAMAGTIDLVQRGLTGLETREDALWLDPAPLRELRDFGFDLRYRGHWGVGLHIIDGRVRVSLPDSEAAPVRVVVKGQVAVVGPGQVVELPY